MIVLALGAMAIVWFSGNRSAFRQPSEAPDEPASTATIPIVRQTLRSVERFPADLTYGESRDLTATTSGVVTWVAPVNSLVGSGDRLWAIDNQPTVFLIGELPLYRELYRGAERGPDIEQLEQILIGLGYGPTGWEPDDRFNWTTRTAVREFEDDHDLIIDGRLSMSEVVIGQQPLRVASTANIGDAVTPTQPVVGTTSPDAVVTITISSRQYAWLRDRTQLWAELIDQRKLGLVFEDAVPTPDESNSTTYDVSYRSDAVDIKPQPVELVVEETIATDALVVPVDALVALVEGGYALEVAQQGESVLRRVEVIGFDDTLVAVEGDVAEGDAVVVP